MSTFAGFEWCVILKLEGCIALLSREGSYGPISRDNSAGIQGAVFAGICVMSFVVSEPCITEMRWPRLS